MPERTLPRWPLLCAAVAVLAYLPAVRLGFVLDDVRLVENNPSIASVSNLPRLFLEPYWNVPGENYGLYRPLTIATFAIERAVHGPAPSGFHAVNVALHALVTALSWLCLRRAGAHYGTALAGALLFSVLPIHSEAVANIAGRAELLAATLVLCAWLAHRSRPSLAAFAYGAAILSKESAVLAPLLFFADEALSDRRGGPERRGRIGRYAAALAVVVALRVLALGVHQTAEGTIALDNPAAAAGVWPRIATAAWVQCKYFMLCLAPIRLVSDYSLDAIPSVVSALDVRFLCGCAFIAALGGAVVLGMKRDRPLARAALIWGVFFLPSANLLFPTGTVMAERLAYLPSLGVCLAAGHLAAGFAAVSASESARSLRRGLAVAGVGIVVIAGAGRVWARVPAWSSNLTLAVTDVAASPRSAKLQAGAGMFLAEAGRVDEAESHLRRAIEIYPDYAQMHYNLAVLLARRGARDEAVEHLQRAIALAPGNPMPRQLLQSLGR